MEDGVIIDNLVQIAHNVHIGSNTAIAAKCGIAGSSKIGKNCILGGACGVSGHLSITDNVTFTAMSMVTKNISVAGTYHRELDYLKIVIGKDCCTLATISRCAIDPNH